MGQSQNNLAAPSFPLAYRGAAQRLGLAEQGSGNWGHHFAEISKEIVPIGPQMEVCRANRSLRYLGFSSVQGAVVRSGGPWT
jgi:hypothetical protein